MTAPSPAPRIGSSGRATVAVTAPRRPREPSTPGPWADTPPDLPAEELRRRLDGLRTTAERRQDRTLSGIIAACGCALEEWERVARRLRSLEEQRERTAVLAGTAHARLVELLAMVDRLGEAPSGGGPGHGASVPARVGLVVRLLGGFDVRVDGHPVREWAGRRGHAVLQYLVVHRDRPVPRDVLVEAVWPELDGRAGRRRLHQAVYALRQSLRGAAPGRTLVECLAGGYRLDPGCPVWTDVAAFEELAAAAGTGAAGAPEAQARAAVRLYRGDLLPDEDLEWVEARRASLRRSFVDVATGLAGRLAATSDPAAVLAVTTRVLDVDPWHEECVRLQMHAHVTRGESVLAVRAFRRYREELQQELGVEPSATMRAALADVLAARHAEPSGPVPTTGPESP